MDSGYPKERRQPMGHPAIGGSNPKFSYIFWKKLYEMKSELWQTQFKIATQDKGCNDCFYCIKDVNVFSTKLLVSQKTKFHKIMGTPLLVLKAEKNNLFVCIVSRISIVFHARSSCLVVKCKTHILKVGDFLK